MERPDREYIGRGHYRRGAFREGHQHLEGFCAAAQGIPRIAHEPIWEVETLGRSAFQKCRASLAKVADPAAFDEDTADEGDLAVAEPHQMIHEAFHAGPVVYADDRDTGHRSLPPQPDDRDVGVSQVLHEARLIAGVSEQEDGVTMACLEDGAQGNSLVRATVGVTQYDVVATSIGLRGDGVDGTREEWVRDLADNHAQKHGASAAQTACQWVRAIAHLASHFQDPLASRRVDRDGIGRPGEDPRDGALGNAAGSRNVLHGRHACGTCRRSGTPDKSVLRPRPGALGWDDVGRLDLPLGDVSAGRSSSTSWALGCHRSRVTPLAESLQ